MLEFFFDINSVYENFICILAHLYLTCIFKRLKKLLIIKRAAGCIFILLPILGIMLYELLVRLDKEEWMKIISDLRNGYVSHDDRVTPLEKGLINFLLTPDPNYRPKKIESIVQTVNCLINEGIMAKLIVLVRNSI